MFGAKQQSGFSLIETIVVTAIMVIVFGAILLAYQFALNLSNQSKAKLSALSVANDRMEFLRSLPYDDVGTIAGIPAGTIPQLSTTSLNGIEFTERVLIEYVDDPADGLLGADGNLIITDYKRVKLEYSWNLSGTSNSVFLVTNIVPRSIESTGGGGTVRVNVLDETAALLPGATVRLINNSGIGPIDISRTTDVTGSAIFSGAPAGGDYEVIVTGPISGRDYSTDQTYEVTGANPNPVASPFAVLEADISTQTFQIGELSDLNLTTVSSLLSGAFTEDFTDLTGSVSSTSVVSNGSELVLADTLGVYELSGEVYLGPFTPGTFTNWHSARIVVDLPGSTAYVVRFYTGSVPGPYNLIPDSALSGNAAGFSSSIIDLSLLDAATYPTIFTAVFLTTSDTSVTPAVEELSIFYDESSTVRPNTSFAMRGNKLIGTDASAQPIYKYTDSVSTDGSGEATIPDLEFDTYELEFSTALDIATACGGYPIIHQAGVESDAILELVADTDFGLRVAVQDGSGNPLPGVTVELDRTGVNEVAVTNNCGQVYFPNLPVATDYQITASAVGFDTEILSDVDVSDDTVAQIILTEA